MSDPTEAGAPRVARGLAATTWGPGRLDLFWVDEDRALWHSASNDGAWAEPESLGGDLASSPTAVAWAEGEMEVFAVMDDGELWNRYWDHSYWHPWEALGGELDPTSTPASSLTYRLQVPLGERPPNALLHVAAPAGAGFR